MSASEHNHLFNQTGPQSMLDYLQSRLAARDLSAEEALAMLGAVHEELNNPANADRGVYQRYSEFMESLRTEMPDVHDYVVSAWGQRGENKDKTEKDDEREYDDVEARERSESVDVEALKKSESGSPKDGDVSEKGGDEEGGEEGDEPDKVEAEREEEAYNSGEKESDKSDAEESNEAEEESAKDEGKEGEAEAEKEEEQEVREFGIS